MRPVLPFLAALVLAAASGCGGDSQPGCAQGNRAVGTQAPDFTLSPLEEGRPPVTLSEVSRTSGVLLVFWATWCPSCVAEIPILNEWQEKYASSGLKILGVNVEEPRPRVLDFAQRYPMEYPVLLDPEGHTAEAYGLVGLPVSVLLAPGGKVVYYGFGLPRIEDFLEPAASAPAANALPWPS